MNDKPDPNMLGKLHPDWPNTRFAKRASAPDPISDELAELKDFRADQTRAVRQHRADLHELWVPIPPPPCGDCGACEMCAQPTPIDFAACRAAVAADIAARVDAHGRRQAGRAQRRLTTSLAFDLWYAAILVSAGIGIGLIAAVLIPWGR